MKIFHLRRFSFGNTFFFNSRYIQVAREMSFSWWHYNSINATNFERISVSVYAIFRCSKNYIEADLGYFKKWIWKFSFRSQQVTKLLRFRSLVNVWRLNDWFLSLAFALYNYVLTCLRHNQRLFSHIGNSKFQNFLLGANHGYTSFITIQIFFF